MYNLFKYIFYLVLIITLVEVFLRFFGYKPADIKQRIYYEDYFKKYPSIFQIDSILGFKNKPGEYYIPILNDTTLIKYTINENNERITSLNKVKYKDEILMIGCSYTFGANLNDTSYAAAMLQNKILSYGIKVRNIAGDAYGLTQFYLQVKKLDNSDNHIKALIINYASFHNERAIMARSFLSGLIFAMHNKINVPYATLEHDTLQIKYKPLKYQLFPLQGYLASIELISNIYNKYERRNEEKIAYLLLEKIATICKEKKINLILVELKNDKTTHKLVGYFKDKGIYTLAYNIDLNSPEYNFLPYDVHPNAKANKIFADSIFNNLINFKIIE